MDTTQLQVTSRTTWYQEQKVETRSGHTMPFLVFPKEEKNGNRFYLALHPFLPFDKKDQADAQFSFFLSKNPFPDKSYFRPYLEKTWIKLKLKLGLPDSLIADNSQLSSVEPVFLRSVHVSLKNMKTDAILAFQEKNGLLPEFELKAVVGPDESDEILQTLNGKASALFLEMCAVFSLPGDAKQIKTIRSSYPLQEVLLVNAPEKEYNWKKIFQLYFFEAKAGVYQQLPGIKQHQQARTRLSEKVIMLKSGSSALSLNQALKPGNGLVAHHVLNSHLSHQFGGNFYKIDDLQIITRPQSLPIVENEKQEFWKDRKDEKLYWCVPEFHLLKPGGQEQPEQSPFRFLFKKIGQDAEGRAVLEGEVKCSVEKKISSKVQQAVEKLGPEVKSRLLNLKGLSIQLEIPFRTAEGTAESTFINTQDFREEGNKITCIFRLTNQWIRACYGAASVEDFQQDRPLKIWISYTFQAYVPVKKQNFDWLANYKISALPLLKSRSKKKTYFNKKENKLVLNDDQEIFIQDLPENKAGIKAKNKKWTPVGIISKPTLAHAAISVLNPGLNKVEVDKIQEAEQFSVQTFGKKECLDVLFRCEDYGHYFQEEDEGAIHSIGCKEPYRLGQVDFKLYEPLSALDHSLYKVYRSTQSPNSFMVVPGKYKITRFEGDKGEQAFQACMRMYSTIDIENIHHSNCVFDASLEPDIPPVVQMELKQALQQYTPYEPQLEYISEKSNEATYFLPNLDAVIHSLKCFAVGRVIRLSMAARIQGVLTLQSLLRSGAFNGKASFELPDGTSYESLLEPSLSDIGGSWSTGPFEIGWSGGVFKLTNRIEWAVNLQEIKLFSSKKLERVVPLNRQLQPGEQAEIPEDDQSLTALPVYCVVAGTIELEEVRNYMEDIQCQLICLTTLDFGQHQLEHIEVEVRLHSSSHSTKAMLTKEQPSQELMLLMPLSVFAAERVIEFRTKSKKTGQAVGAATAWQSLSLATQGNIIKISSSHISIS